LNDHPDKLFRILSLDGGGAKGFYTLGVLKQIEAMAGPLHEKFDLVFGTSTGSIIAALICLGHPVEEILTLYRDHVIKVMRKWTPCQKSAALQALQKEIFGELAFSDLKTNIGIVATNWKSARPIIFKTSKAQGHGSLDTFVPGFGCTIGDAVQASCSAYPFFTKRIVKTNFGEKIELADGGYPLAPGCRRIWRGEVWKYGFRGAVADFVLVISGSRRRPRRSQVRGQLRHDPIATAG